MTVLSYLLLSVALFFVMILVQALFGVKQYGLTSLAGPRDELDAADAMLARSKRAIANMVEGMAIFVPLALIAIHTGTEGKALTGATLFFWGRLVYAPVYWFGVPWFRTLVWAVSVLGLLMMFAALMALI